MKKVSEHRDRQRDGSIYLDVVGSFNFVSTQAMATDLRSEIYANFTKSFLRT